MKPAHLPRRSSPQRGYGSNRKPVVSKNQAHGGDGVELFRDGGEFAVEGGKTGQFRTAGEMEGIGEVHPLRVPGESLGNVGGVLRFDVRQAEDVEQPFMHGLPGEIVAGGRREEN